MGQLSLLLVAVLAWQFAGSETIAVRSDNSSIQTQVNVGMVTCNFIDEKRELARHRTASSKYCDLVSGSNDSY